MRYVLGFLFNEDRSSVVLIRKSKPVWQSGLLNGVGGKIEEGETPLNAMIREFREEAGVDTTQIKWRQYCTMVGKDFEVICFTVRDTKSLELAHTVEQDPIFKINWVDFYKFKCVSNLSWLMALATDENYGNKFYVTAQYGMNYE